MKEEMFNHVDNLVSQRWVDEMVEKAYHVAYDAMMYGHPIEVDDVLNYIDTVIRERVKSIDDVGFKVENGEGLVWWGYEGGKVIRRW
jgi:hypothetical protein